MCVLYVELLNPQNNTLHGLKTNKKKKLFSSPSSPFHTALKLLALHVRPMPYLLGFSIFLCMRCPVHLTLISLDVVF